MKNIMPKKEAIPANAKGKPTSAGAMSAPSQKLSPLAQSVIDQITKLDRAGQLTSKSKVTLSVNGSNSALAGDTPEESEEDYGFQPEAEVDGVVAPSRGKIGVYDEGDDTEAEEGSMLEAILNAVTKKVATPPLRNSKGQVSVIRMSPGVGDDL